MSRAPNMKDMRERLEAIRGQIAVLKGQESLLLDMMNEAPKEPTTKRAAKGSVKVRVLDLLEKQGRSGLNAARAVELSEASGDVLDRGSVSSLLSRLKQDDVVAYDGSNYRLKKYTVMPGAVTPLRTSSEGSF